MRDKFDIPMVLKGIATAEDAALACEHGVEVVYVSNHGGRQLDHGRGTLAILPEVVEAIAGRAEIVVDGGVLRGSDVVKAIATGADAVGIGRLFGFGISVAGEAGIVRVLEILEQEIRTCLALLGVRGFDELDPAYVQRAPAVLDPGFASAFPLLDEEY
jgi:glycolate oxidase